MPVAAELSKLQTEIHALAKKKGWWDGFEATPDAIASRLALIHSEVSEALEDVREHRMGLDHEMSGKPIGFPSELADVVIRCLDLAGGLGIDLFHVVKDKHAYNKTRPHRHGGKAL